MAADEPLDPRRRFVPCGRVANDDGAARARVDPARVEGADERAYERVGRLADRADANLVERVEPNLVVADSERARSRLDVPGERELRIALAEDGREDVASRSREVSAQGLAPVGSWKYPARARTVTPGRFTLTVIAWKPGAASSGT